MKLAEAIDTIIKFQEAISTKVPEVSFSYEFCRREELFKNCFRKEVPADGASSKSGVYFIMSPDETILYIGKATEDNLGKEIWSKFSAPSRILDFEKDTPVFENSNLAKFAPDEYSKNLLIQGDVKFAAVSVNPGFISSLIEVYLHVYCEKTQGHLPPLNKRIG